MARRGYWPYESLSVAREQRLATSINHVWHPFDIVANVCMALTLSGALSGAPAAARAARLAAASLHVRREIAIASYIPEDDSRWMAAVHELAGRGFTLEKLLEFYAQLGV